MQIDAVLLDVGGVFHLPDPDTIVRAMARLGVTVDPAELPRAHYAGVAALEDFREGDREIWIAYNHGYARALGAPEEIADEAAEALLAEFTSGAVWTHVIEGSREALRELAALDVRLAVVSNADGSVERQLREDGICQVGPGDGVPVDVVLDSSVVGVAKPDPRIFAVALDAVGVSADRAVHVGDTPGADVAGALAAGVTPVLVDPFDDHATLPIARVTHLADVVEMVRASRA